MIGFGTIVLEPEAHRRYAGPGIARTVEPGAVVHTFSGVGTLGRGFNLLLDAALQSEDLEAFVLVHPHCEIDDPAFHAKVRTALADPDVAIVGAAGATGVRGAAWWEGEQVYTGQTVHRYTELRGGDLPAYAWTDPQPGPAEVDAVDGFLMVFSPWAVEHLRFDEDLWIGLGWDVDVCRRAREQGRKVVMTDMRSIWHRELDLVGEVELFAAGHLQYAEKWSPGEADADWRTRARRAEADREAVRIEGYFRAIVGEARVLALEAELERLEASPGWALTKPLRVLNARRRARA